MLPWKTLAKASSHVFFPGDSLNLLRGDTWTGETLAPQGNGNYQRAVYDAFFSAAKAAALASYLAGPLFTRISNVYQANGYTVTNANAQATLTCTAFADYDATESALNSMKTVAEWITIQPYGSGANPRIQPGAGVGFGIQFDINAFTGGWMIQSIDVANADNTGISAQVNGSATGLWIEGCNVSGCLAIPPPASSGANQFPAGPGSNSFCSTGVCTDAVANVVVKSTNINNCQLGILVTTCDGCLWNTVNVTNCPGSGAYQSTHIAGPAYPIGPSARTFSRHSVIRNCTIDTVALTGPWFGGIGLENNGVETQLIVDTTIRNVQRSGTTPDSEGADQEGGTIDTTYLRVTIQNCAGAPLLNEPTASLGDNIRTKFLDCHFVANGVNPDNPSASVSTLRSAGNLADVILWDGCDITMLTSTQPRYQYPQHGAATNTPLSVWVFGTNTWHFP